MCLDQIVMNYVSVQYALYFKDLVPQNIKDLNSNFYIDYILKLKYFGYTELNKLYY